MHLLGLSSRSIYPDIHSSLLCSFNIIASQFNIENFMFKCQSQGVTSILGGGGGGGGGWLDPNFVPLKFVLEPQLCLQNYR